MSGDEQVPAGGWTAGFSLRAGIPLPTPATALRGAEFDLVVVGGGIYGAWTALEARLQGYRVALVERGAWASGTSRASSKLIHGGLRYLEHGEVGLVRKALRERARLLRLAPHRVRPIRFLIPVTRHGRLARWQLELGLHFYDALAGDLAGIAPVESWPRATVLAGAPFLPAAELRAGYTYGDAATDDAALVRDVVAAAQQAGAVCVAQAPVAALLRTAGRVAGIALAGGETVRATTTVLAAGPWAFTLACLDPQRAARFTKGVHLVLPPLPLAVPFAVADTALLLTAPQDGRVFFLIPWRGGTMVGTTDTDFSGAPDSAAVHEADVDYLLTAVEATCPGLGWTTDDICDAWVGVRTLRPGAAGASALTRDWELRQPEPGLLLPVGGKLTSARVEAVRIVAALPAPLV
jgi:glycerol-3-phosphate dehydrogenase